MFTDQRHAQGLEGSGRRLRHGGLVVLNGLALLLSKPPGAMSVPLVMPHAL
jgi:hypothetical protein